MDTGLLATDRFRSMNADVLISLAIPQSPEAMEFQEARSWFRYAEKVFSRFRPDSELGRLNHSAGQSVRISRTMEEVLRLAEHWQGRSEGSFHPGILPHLLTAGYTLSYERLGQAEADLQSQTHTMAKASSDKPDHCPAVGEWKLFEASRSVKLDSHAQIDLGGIVKGWTVDRIANRFTSSGIPAGLVNAGGDLQAWSRPEHPEWEIGIEDPRTPANTLGTVVFRTGAVATSSVLGKSWITERGPQHHLIDPHTGTPAATDVLQCTVAGVRAADAEAAAKTICLKGSREGLAWLTRACPNDDALLLTREGRIVLHLGTPIGTGRLWKGV